MVLFASVAVATGLSLVSNSLSAPRVHVLQITLSDDVINPVTARYIERGIRQAADSKAQCLLLHLDTPGGLVSSTKQIISAFMDAEVPVVVYVAPEHAGALSAGVLITTAAHVAAMAPLTTIGAAHPVFGGSPGGGGEGDNEMTKVMSEKVTNALVSYAKNIAKQRNRSAKWIEEAIRSSVAISAEEALEKNVIDLIAPDVVDLLKQIDGREVKLKSRSVTLHTKGADVRELDMVWNERFLNWLANPTIAYFLMMIALYGIIGELSHPGAVFPGVVGAVCLILFLFSFSLLPINLAGAALIVLGVGLMLADLKVPSHGVLTLGGVVAFVLGSFMLVDAPIPELRVPWVLIVTMAGATVAFFVFAISYGIRAQLRRVDTGSEGMVGMIGKAKTVLDPEGTVFVRGEFWNACAATGEIPQGSKVRVVGVDGMELTVESAQSE